MCFVTKTMLIHNVDCKCLIKILGSCSTCLISMTNSSTSFNLSTYLSLVGTEIQGIVTIFLSSLACSYICKLRVLLLPKFLFIALSIFYGLERSGTLPPYPWGNPFLGFRQQTPPYFKVYTYMHCVSKTLPVIPPLLAFCHVTVLQVAYCFP